MASSHVHRPYAEAPASADLVPCPAGDAWTGLQAHRFEILSRGDFVPGMIYSASSPDTPDAASASKVVTPAPLLLIAHDVRGSSTSRALECAAPWARKGLVVAAIDLPLHGRRRSAKLSERLCQGFDRMTRGETLDSQTRALVDEFARQSTSDLIRTIDALTARSEIDDQRVAFLGLGLGAAVGCYLLAHDRRPRAAVLTGAGAGWGPPELDPATWIASASEVELLVVASSRSDAKAPLAAAQALLEAAPQPRRIAIHDDDDMPLAPAALDEISAFLDSTLTARRRPRP